MPLKKVIEGSNMYQGWVTHTHSHLAGECPHKCGYCYVQTNPHGVSSRYKGAHRLIEEELKVNYGKGKIIFIEHMNDLFSEWTFPSWIQKILSHCNQYPDNTYIFQSKCPTRVVNYLRFFPPKFMMGTTIESNRIYGNTKADPPVARYRGMKELKELGIKIFITIEPIMDFDVNILTKWIIDIQPEFVNIGADSKHCNLPEPSPAKVRELISKLQAKGIVIKKKTNLERILRADPVESGT